MNDVDGPSVAELVYGPTFALKEYNPLVRSQVISYALDAAVRVLRESGVHPSRWATFVHIGE
jgi:hypothetical protein